MLDTTKIKETILSINGISKTFGDKQVLNNISLDVKEGSVYGFIGQNGAGKTTTMKIILGLLKCDKGSVTVCGEKVTYGQNRTNKYIGYLPDVPEFYSYMKADEYLRLCGEITCMDKKVLKDRIEQLVDLVGLDKCKTKIGAYSRGMKQRLGIAQALLNKPRLLICDEPTSALDPVGRKDILDILKKSNTTVIFSTHILTDVERICDNIAMLNKGKIVLEGSIDSLKKKYPEDELLIEFATIRDKQKFLQNSKYLNTFEIVYEGECEIKLRMNCSDLKINELIRSIVDDNIMLRKFEKLEPSLENIFMEVVE